MTSGRWLWSLALVALAARALAAVPSLAPWPVRLQSAVVKEARRFDGELALVVHDLGSGQRYTHNAATPMYLASGIKLLVLIAVFEAEHEGSLRLDETLELTADDVRDGAPRLKHAQPGDQLSVLALCEHMMQHSDNMATDLLIRRVGLDAVNAAAQRHGGPEFGPVTTLLEVRRAVYRELDPRADQLTPAQVASIRAAGSLAARARSLAALLGLPARRLGARDLRAAHERFYDSLANSASLDAVAALLGKMARGQVVSAEASAQMIAIMRGCQTGSRRLRAGLPASVALAHKTGTQVGRLCDLGVAYPSEGAPVVIAACAKGFASSRRAEAVLARVARTAHASIVEERAYRATQDATTAATRPATTAPPASETAAHTESP